MKNVVLIQKKWQKRSIFSSALRLLGPSVNSVPVVENSGVLKPFATRATWNCEIIPSSEHNPTTEILDSLFKCVR